MILQLNTTSKRSLYHTSYEINVINVKSNFYFMAQNIFVYLYVLWNFVDITELSFVVLVTPECLVLAVT